MGKKALGKQSVALVHPAQAQRAIDVFWNTSSPDDIRRVVAELPFTTSVRFIAAVEQVITQLEQPEQQIGLKQRLACLREIASE
jgi:hypothetical protein